MKKAVICMKDAYVQCNHLRERDGVLLLSLDGDRAERKKYKNSSLSVVSIGKAKIAVCELLTDFEESATYAYTDGEKFNWGINRIFSEDNYIQTHIIDVDGNFETLVKSNNIALRILEGEIEPTEYNIKHNYFKRKRGAFRR